MSPDLVLDHDSRQHAARITHETLENLKLSIGEGNALAVQHDLSSIGVQDEIVHPKASFDIPIVPAHHGLQACT